MANLLFWIGPDRIIYGTDFPIWYPHWQLDEFMEFELPEDLKAEYGVDLTMEMKEKIIGGNIMRLYGIDPVSKQKAFENDEVAQRKRAYASSEAGLAAAGKAEATDTGVAGTVSR